MTDTPPPSDDKAKVHDAPDSKAQAGADASHKLVDDAHKASGSPSASTNASDASAADKPAADKPAADKPDSDKPAADKSGTAKSGADNHAADSKDNKAEAAKEASNSFMSEVFSDWDALKNYVMPTDNKPAPQVTVKDGAGDAKAEDTKAAGDTKAAAAKSDDSFWDWAKMGDIFSSGSSSANKDAAANPAAPISVKDGTGDAKANLSTPTSASSSNSWADSLYQAGEQVTSFVSKGWDSLSDSFDSTYKSLATDSGNTTSKVEAKLGSDGKTDYFENTLDNNTRALAAGEHRQTDDKGNTIITNAKTHETTTQTADGQDSFTKKADGTEVYRHLDTEYTKGKDGTYKVVDGQGNETTVKNDAALTQLGNGFAVAQTLYNLDAHAIKAEKGKLIAAPDGQEYMTKGGADVMARTNGVREVTTPSGKHFRIDDAHHKIEVEEGDKWRTLSATDFAKFDHCHRKVGADGKAQYDIGGVTIKADGSVSTDDKVTLGQTAPGGKMVAHLPSDSGKGATVVNNADKTTDLINNGTDTKFDPNNPAHRVERFGINADGSLGASQFNYNSDNGDFCTPDVQFYGNGTTDVDWAQLTFDAAGAVTYGDGSSVYDSTPTAYTNSDVQGDNAVHGADTAVAAVSAKLGSSTFEAGDIAALNSSLGDLDGALSQALSSGNLEAAGEIISAKGEVSTALAQATQQVALADNLRAKGLGDDNIVDAAGDVNGSGPQGAAVREEVKSMGPDAKTFEGKLAYMQQFGISGLSDEQASRLSA